MRVTVGRRSTCVLIEGPYKRELFRASPICNSFIPSIIFTGKFVTIVWQPKVLNDTLTRKIMAYEKYFEIIIFENYEFHA